MGNPPNICKSCGILKPKGVRRLCDTCFYNVNTTGARKCRKCSHTRPISCFLPSKTFRCIEGIKVYAKLTTCSGCSGKIKYRICKCGQSRTAASLYCDECYRVRELVTPKCCTKCKQKKPITAFGKQYRFRIISGEKVFKKQTVCQDCVSYRLKRNLWTRWGLDLKEVDGAIASSTGVCSICKRDDGELVVDHCHTNKKFRGLLCDNCNHGLGSFFDDINIMLNAIDYIEQFEGKVTN